MSLPVFESFPVHSEESTVGTRWKRWHARLENLTAALNITQKARKKALLLHYAGEEVFNIYDSFTDEQKGIGSEDEYKSLIESFDAHFTPKKNLDFETFRFRQFKQNHDESIDCFHTRLRLQATRCEFAEVEKEIKAQIIQGCTSSRLRKRALRDDKLTLTQLLDTARVLELSDKQAQEIEGEQSANFVSRNHHASGSKSKSKFQQNPNQNRQQSSNTKSTSAATNHTGSKKCYWCGAQPHHPRNKCPAKDKQCKSCSKLGHFSSVCRSKPDSRSSVRQVQAATDCDSSGESDHGEYVFGVKNGNKTPCVDINLSGEQVPFFIDTGASVNILDERSFKNLNAVTLKSSSTNIYGYGFNKPLNVIGQFTTEISYKDNSTSATFYVVRSENTSKGGNLLSSDTAEKLQLISFAFTANSTSNAPKSKHTHADKLCHDNPSLFQGLGKLKDVKVTLFVDETVQPTAQQHRRIPYHMRKQVEKKIQRLEDLDIIEKVDGPTPWISPVIAVPKKTPGEIRLCVDMRLPNTAIKRTRHYMPSLDDILMQLNGAKVFSKLDLNQGYHQLELDEESRNITTFSTHVGLRRYKRLNFGVASAAEVFQNHIAEVISDISGAMNTSDDILIYGKTQEDHDATLTQVFKRLKDKNLTLNQGKCEFNKDHIEFYGFIFGSQGMSPDPKKVSAIHNASPPTNQKELRSFLGLTNYMSRFIPDYATITKPLRDLTRKDAEWNWTSEQESAFSMLKSKLTSDKVMQYYNPDASTQLIVDASPLGLGGILQNRDKDGTEHTVAYASRALSDVESRYSQTEREALAVVWACEHFHLYLLGTHFTVISDHKSLEEADLKKLI